MQILRRYILAIHPQFKVLMTAMILLFSSFGYAAKPLEAEHRHPPRQVSKKKVTTKKEARPPDQIPVSKVTSATAASPAKDEPKEDQAVFYAMGPDGDFVPTPFLGPLEILEGALTPGDEDESNNPIGDSAWVPVGHSLSTPQNETAPPSKDVYEPALTQQKDKPQTAAAAAAAAEEEPAIFTGKNGQGIRLKTCAQYTNYITPVFFSGRSTKTPKVPANYYTEAQLDYMVRVGQGQNWSCELSNTAMKELKMNGSGICIHPDGKRAKVLGLAYKAKTPKGRHDPQKISLNYDKGSPRLREVRLDNEFAPKERIGGLTASGIPPLPFYTLACNRTQLAKVCDNPNGVCLVYIEKARGLKLPGQSLPHSGYFVCNDTGGAFLNAHLTRYDIHTGIYEPDNPKNPFASIGMADPKLSYCEQRPIIVTDPILKAAVVNSFPASPAWRKEVLAQVLNSKSGG